MGSVAYGSAGVAEGPGGGSRLGCGEDRGDWVSGSPSLQAGGLRAGPGVTELTREPNHIQKGE